MKKNFLIFLITSLTIVFLTTAIHAQNELVVMTWGGSWGDSLKRNIAEPFQKEFAVKVTIVNQLNNRDGLNKVIAQKDNPQVDVWTADVASHSLAANHGLLEEVAESKIPNLKYSQIKGTKNSVNWYILNPGIFYAADKTPFALKSWEDLWDARLKGKVAVPDATYCSGQFLVVAALIAGGSEYKIQPAFDKLEKLKPNIAMFFKTDSESIKFLESGEASVAAMGLLPNVYSLLGKGSKYKFVIPEKPQLAINDNVAILKGRKNTALAYKFVNYMLSTKAQEAHCASIGTAPVNREAKAPAAMADIVPKQLKNLYEINFDEVNKNLAEWTEIYNKRIKQ